MPNVVRGKTERFKITLTGDTPMPVRYFLLLLAAVFAISVKAGAQPFAYITNETDGTVSVINTATNTVVDTVPVGNTPYGVAVTPDGAFVYVTTSPSSVSVISAASNTVPPCRWVTFPLASPLPPTAPVST